MRVAGWLYDREGERQNAEMGLVRKAGQELMCRGAACYRVSFLVMMAASAFGSLVSVVLVLRTRGFYRGDIYGRFKKVEGENEEIAGTALSTSTQGLTKEEK